MTKSADLPVLSAIWGGDRANLTVGIDTTRIEFDCGIAIIAGRLEADRGGHFSETGYFEEFAGGPVDPDVPANRRRAEFRGQIAGDILNLTMHVSGEDQPRHLRLARNHRVKLLRCV